MGTAIVLIILAAAVGGVIYKLYRNRKEGKSSCGCGGDCGKCSSCGR